MAAGRFWFSKAVNESPARIEDLIAKPLVRCFKHNVLFLKNPAIPKQTFRAKWQAPNFVQVLFKYRWQVRFVGCKRRQCTTHLSTAFWKPDLIGEDGSRCGDDLSGRRVTLTRVTHFTTPVVMQHRSLCQAMRLYFPKPDPLPEFWLRHSLQIKFC